MMLCDGSNKVWSCSETATIAADGPTVCLIDAFDSFVYVIEQYLGELDATTRVLRSSPDNANTLREMKPDAIVLGPGPVLRKTPGTFSCSMPSPPRCRYWGCAWAIRQSESLSAPRCCGPGTSCMASAACYLTTGSGYSKVSLIRCPLPAITP